MPSSGFQDSDITRGKEGENMNAEEFDSENNQEEEDDSDCIDRGSHN